MKNDSITIREVYTFSFSCLLHILLLGILYCIPLHTSCIPQSASYQIALQLTTVSNLNSKIMQNKQSSPFVEKSIDRNKKYISRNIKKRTDVAYLYRNKKKRENPCIDRRGLYTSNNSIKSTGVLLELAGWTWDMVPKPQDTTTETGKVVFEIKVDKYGEIVAIRTLEKTITPLLEKIYADALSGLTFSKTASTHLYTPISIGKVTFLIQAK